MKTLSERKIQVKDGLRYCRGCEETKLVKKFSPSKQKDPCARCISCIRKYNQEYLLRPSVIVRRKDYDKVYSIKNKRAIRKKSNLYTAKPLNRIKKRKIGNKSTSELSNGYVMQLLRSQFGLATIQITSRLIEAKRKQLLTTREIKKLKEVLSGTN